MRKQPKEIWADTSSLIIDVRSPLEYQKGKIPGAINMPLFTDEERAIVGTLYKQGGQQQAIVKGLEIVGPKMSAFVRKANELAYGKKILLYCWRGGKRSSSMAWLFQMAGHDVDVIEGGYKSYRKFIRSQIEKAPLKLLILGGKTGCDKTTLLKKIQKKGKQFIDLEGLANHKGSAFGSLGKTPQPSVEQFENNLYEVIRQLDTSKVVWVENENQSIGAIFILHAFWNHMKTAPVINMERPIEQRIEIIKNQYGNLNIEDLKASFFKIKKRLGGQNLNKAVSALAENNISEAIKVALFYYDKAYQYYLDKNESPKIFNIKFTTESDEEIVDRLIGIADKAFVLSALEEATRIDV